MAMTHPAKEGVGDGISNRRDFGWNAILWAIFLAVFVPPGVFAGAQATRLSPKSFAFRHSVVVIGPNSPVFDIVLEKDFQGVTQVNYFQQIKPLLAIVHNNTRRVVKAYVVKWTITNSDGSTSTTTLPVMWEPSPGDPRLAGSVTILGPAGTGLGTELVSPYFHWTKREFPGLVKVSVVFGLFQAASVRSLVSAAQKASSVQVKLDGAVFGDGVFVGPDTSKLFERFEAAQRADVDEAAWIQGELKGGLTDQQLRDALSEQVYKGRRATGSSDASLYATACGEAASRLLSLLNSSGQSGLERFSLGRSAAKGMTLQRKADR